MRNYYIYASGLYYVMVRINVIGHFVFNIIFSLGLMHLILMNVVHSQKKKMLNVVNIIYLTDVYWFGLPRE